MSWSYDDALATDRDKVRFYIDDTDATDQLLSNETIDALLVMTGGVVAAAIQASMNLALHFGRKADMLKEGDLQKDYRNRVRVYEELAKNLKEINVLGVPFAGGISVSDKQTYNDDSDRVAPRFERDMMSGDNDNNPAVSDD